MARTWSGRSLSDILLPPIPKREKLGRYSWLFDIVRYKGSLRIGRLGIGHFLEQITGRIFGPVLTCTLFATVVAVLYITYDYKVQLTNQVVPLLSVVVGLILVFRNGWWVDYVIAPGAPLSSLCRYEGSKDWEATVSHTRNVSRQIWVFVTLPPPERKSILTKDSLRELKIRALRLIVAFLYATKHHLRDEPGIDYEDYQGLFPDGFSTYLQTSIVTGSQGSSPSGGNTPNRVTRPRVTNVGTSKTVVEERTPLLNGQSHIIHFHEYPATQPLPLPLIIAHEISCLLHYFQLQGCLAAVGPAGANALSGMIQGMVSQFAKMERVCNTPIPDSYGIHLKQCVTLYLFTLPFTLVADLRWFMIPVVTVVSFTLMGIEGIADEIEMPFGTDHYDLPLDRICGEIRGEVEYIIERMPEGGLDYRI
ncbi:Bestrophin, RFP-TM, chloride channel-domain-containing protein [Cantharellus anzutake]|uniref:Bestrophin, RFP-TM, chloride channel-domain-containing protein n=1 Tax=Cantharellus anzutake TaxID=1750568 RepID=UPI0019047737|nr:Bestrophin, RFP-TM, chloride channel-domain-containing protein [Cantharellus anzutake]KAF8328805.1 Bestrophin, RFP-TM, chloride channel-domain-containing protein [Cantharellus anzutake]